MRRRVRISVVAMALAALVGGACGSDDGGAAESATSAADGGTSGTDDGDCAAGDAGGMGESDVDDPVVPTPTIDGVVVYDDLTHNHVDGCVEYDPIPPVGGDHWGQWQACGFYDEPVQTERAVHSLEHGAVWITYDPTLGDADRATLSGLAADFVLVSPWAGDPLPGPVVASAWGLQLVADGADDPRLAEFVAAYANGPQNREAGAPCVEGGVTDTV